MKIGKGRDRKSVKATFHPPPKPGKRSFGSTEEKRVEILMFCAGDSYRNLTDLARCCGDSIYHTYLSQHSKQTIQDLVDEKLLHCEFRRHGASVIHQYTTTQTGKEYLSIPLPEAPGPKRCACGKFRKQERVLCGRCQCKADKADQARSLAQSILSEFDEQLADRLTNNRNLLSE